MKELLYELIIEDDTDEVMAISLVESPAIESDFVYFDKQVVQFAAVDTEQRMLIGPILVPDKKILRVDGEGQPYHVFFTKDTVKKLAQNYLMKKYTDKATLEHGKSIKGVDLVESWVKDGKLDKSNNYGLNLPQGTWVGLFKISDETIWNDYVKTGKVKGFSIEGLFAHKLVQASLVDDFLMEKDITQLSEAEAEIVLSKMVDIIKKDMIQKKVELESYTDYPQSATNNAKRALEYVDKNGWGDCGEATGKARASQLSNREPISRDTIARMASFKRHQQNKDVPYSDGCGGLMWDCWGGTSGIEWAISKLKEIDLAEVGPRGGIRESKKAPNSDTPNKNPQGEGTAKGKASGKRGAEVSAKDEETLQNKVKDFNERDSNTKNGRATLGVLKSVFQRGLGAYTGGHSPNVSSASQWAFARVNAFLYLLKNGRPENAKYVNDNDLLPKEHPKASEKLEANPSIPGSSYGGETAKTKKKEKYVAPALFAEACPPATKNIAINLANRKNAIDDANYGPENPNEPNEEYWKAKADMFGSGIEEAKKAICGNCIFFIQTPAMLDCISSGIDSPFAYDIIKAGDLGYCEAFDFKCASKRTCDAWVVGGPITEYE